MKTISDAIKISNITLDLLENPKDVTEGIYFSHRTGKFFEVLVKKGNIKPKYVCGGFAAEVPVVLFRIQLEVLSIYELVLEYEK